MRKKMIATGYAFLAAILYAMNTPLSKLFLQRIDPTMMAAFLYLGAGVGVGVMYLFHWKQEKPEERLSKGDLPYTIGMIVLDIVAPIFLMLGIHHGTASSASLLGNFEIVATTLIALMLFHEKVTLRLWIAIGWIVAASVLLTMEGTGGLQFSYGSLFVLLATACWGLENNCTRSISEKSSHEIVVLKGFGSGGGALIIACLLGEKLPRFSDVAGVMLLGFVAYGLSIFLYVRAQRTLGAAKTSAYYAMAPFVGAFLSFLLLQETLSYRYAIAFVVMVIGTGFVIADTMVRHHEHMHQHTFTHTHDGSTHTHTVTHSHGHDHYVLGDRHGHHHTMALYLRESGHNDHANHGE
ncbi:MAG: DMT family transporter [Lachnospiraceae bacterium]|nr:DMT family transporter [Lachnospiraceae bacterium]